METGTIFKFHNDLDTDQIIASQYLLLPNLDEMKDHAFESLDPDFSKKVKPGDFVVGGENFGCGSSREQAPGVLKALGVQAVVAKSFARIFYRNSINIGLPVIVCKDLPDEVNTGDKMVLHMSEGTVEANGKTYSCTKLPEYMQNILNCVYYKGETIDIEGENGINTLRRTLNYVFGTDYEMLDSEECVKTYL